MQDQCKKRLVRARSLIYKHGKDCARMGGFLRRKESKRGQMEEGGGEVSDMAGGRPFIQQPVHRILLQHIYCTQTHCVHE